MTFEKIISLPKSLYVCLRLLPFRQAIKLPIYVRYNTKLSSLKGSVILKECKRGLIQIGFYYVGVFDKKYSRSILEISGIMEIEGRAEFGQGTKICIGKKGHLILGHNFCNTAELTVICFDKIEFKKNVLISWNTLIMDTDFHNVRSTNTGKIGVKQKTIFIGNNVWIGTRAVLLKGVYIPDGCIIGANAVVNKSFSEENCLIAGNPAIICKKEITRA